MFIIIFGNVTSIERNGTTYRYEYDKVDRLTKENVPAGENRYSYNGRGSRMTFEGTLPAIPSTASYTFDERNRLRGVTNEKTGAKAEYTYYPDGLRATKTADGGETRYVYLNGRVIEELDKNGQLKAQNIWGNELLSRKDVAANKRGYYLYNSHGDVVKVVGENGEELNRYEYDTWGNITAKTEGMSNPFTYSGEVFDAETGYYYLRARYYDPTVGRFISEDTYKGQVDNPLTLNRYTYVHNNPVRFVDPSGHLAAEGAGGYFGGSYEDLMLYWSDVAVTYADANRLDFIDAVDIVVPVEHRAEVKTIVSFNGAVRANYQAGDVPDLGLAAPFMGIAAAGTTVSKGTSNSGKIPRTGAEWNEYYKSKYGNGNVEWVTQLKSYDDIVSNPKALWGKSADEVGKALGAGWTKGKYGSAGTGWKFTNGDKSVFYHPGEGVHVGSYVGFSSGQTGKVKVVGSDYKPLPGDKAIIIYK
ncbi:RHS repeat-associated core domain-containing protein [Brevibacillus borstelensis]|uniref:RHS repeat-associated core domain-containing protein n=1 Tax=Brevibacillus borstelensis TaxID=45462 RepID=UPI0030C24A6E